MEKVTVEDLPEIDIPNHAAYICRAHVVISMYHREHDHPSVFNNEVEFQNLPIVQDKNRKSINVYGTIKQVTGIPPKSFKIETILINERKLLD